MNEIPKELKVAHSLLEDVEKQIDMIDQGRHEFPSLIADEILKGDLALARNKINSAASKGINVLDHRKTLFFIEGKLAFSVSTNSKLDRSKWAEKSISAFKKALDISEDESTCYNIGIMYGAIGQFTKAIQYMNKVENGNDEKLTIEAAKDIARFEQANKKGLGRKIGCLILFIIFILFLIVGGLFN
ncbi:MAG: hypothetical protein K8T10_04030 [Candidatus Eremiobacteraeota bacterium]|nr:hypothetical protein [Candidatus Eremiobacteraeota bacterium]